MMSKDMIFSPLVDALIFDLDGTLWDTCEACAIAWNRVLKRNQISFRTITAGDVRSVAGKPHAECIRTVFQGLSEPELEVLICETMIEDNRAVEELGGHLYAGVQAGLFELKGQFRLFIVSNCQSGYIEMFLKNFSDPDFFGDFRCWGDTGLSKADNLRQLIAANGIRNPLLIGDTTGDQEAAKSNGVPFAHVEYGFGHCKKADLRFADFLGLKEHLLTLTEWTRPIETDRLVLRHFDLEDSEAFFKLSQDEGFNAFPITVYKQTTVETAREWIRTVHAATLKNKMGMRGIWRKVDRQLIGVCGLRPAPLPGEAEPKVEITYRLRESAWGGGFAREAARAMIKFGFEQMRLPEIIATITPDNLPSIQFAKSLGMKLERRTTYLGKETDVYRLASSEWKTEEPKVTKVNISHDLPLPALAIERESR